MNEKRIISTGEVNSYLLGVIFALAALGQAFELEGVRSVALLPLFIIISVWSVKDGLDLRKLGKKYD